VYIHSIDDCHPNNQFYQSFGSLIEKPELDQYQGRERKIEMPGKGPISILYFS